LSNSSYWKDLLTHLVELVMVQTSETSFLDQADALIRDVHDVLGSTRDGSTRLDDATDVHPILGGLRIGKPDPEGDNPVQSLQSSHRLSAAQLAHTLT
jgi:hypothetical protein